MASEVEISVTEYLKRSGMMDRQGFSSAGRGHGVAMTTSCCAALLYVVVNRGPIDTLTCTRSCC